jgi:hypothetical protein
MRNPLLRSTGVLSALFYESVIVTEGDADRAFYQEINELLLRLDRNRGIRNCIFLNAQNKQTIPTIISPLRNLGIPAAAIYDIDFVKHGGGTAASYLSSAGIPTLLQQSLTALRAAVLQALTNTGMNFKREGGIELLSGSEKEAGINYFDQLRAYGVFIIREGELEYWLKHLGISGHGPTWLIPMFERMGEDPNSGGYVNPEETDVWEFMDHVRSWLLDAKRKGIPG